MCHFLKIFSIFFTIFKKIAPKWQKNDRKMTKNDNASRNAIFATCKSAIFFVIVLSFFVILWKICYFLCHFGAIFSKIVKKIEHSSKNDRKMTKNDRQNWNDKNTTKKIQKNDRQNEMTKKWQKNTDKTEMTKKNDKKWPKKWQPKLKWQKNDNKNDKKWQTNYYDFFNLCLPKFLLTVSTDFVLRSEANWGKELLPTPESGLQCTQEHNGHAWRNDIRLGSVPCTNSTVVCWSSRTGR